ncbi:hypothetical protein SBA4_3940027 [Candidatus Sulfopaludibacter sp. SbA4]|nr:hypothetical protein SBA4_3940027 [Candidatus Sulfopaludibacter sp. SbA4]
MSAVMPRSPFRMAVIRFPGTRRARASALADSPASVMISCRASPGCTGGSFFLLLAMFSFPLMVVHDLDVVGIAIPPLEADSVAVIDADTVLPFPVGLERFQMKARQTEVAQRGRSIQEPEPYQSRPFHVLVLEAGLPLHQAPRLRIPAGANHTLPILRYAYEASQTPATARSVAGSFPYMEILKSSLSNIFWTGFRKAEATARAKARGFTNVESRVQPGSKTRKTAV